jgi:hypothetical protein
MYEPIGGAPPAISLTLFTDAFQIRGTAQTRQRRVTDVLNRAEDPFLVLADVVFDEYGTRGQPIHADYAQVNLASVLFVVSEETIEPMPELRTPKMAEPAIISIPPFKVTGRIHLLPERSLREALSELHGEFVPVTDATYWSDTLGEARTTVPLVVVNHALAQILAPHRELNPWAGLDDAGPARPEGADATGW